VVAENDQAVIVVTSGNRGIGFEICRQLAARVILTARKPATGSAAVKKLAAQKLEVEFRPLDVTDAASIAALGDQLEEVSALGADIGKRACLRQRRRAGLRARKEKLAAFAEAGSASDPDDNKRSG
jgi:NAD(P)-dependent dehydrogenase (short-subunit alcohol dehydrogenase family)